MHRDDCTDCGAAGARPLPDPADLLAALSEARLERPIGVVCRPTYPSGL